MLIKSGETIATVRLDEISRDFGRAELRLEGLKPPVDSYEVRFFADKPDADARTPTRENPHYLASQFFYGLGVPDETLAPGSLYDIQRSSQSARTEVRVNITSGLRKYLQNVPRPEFPVTLVAVDREGGEILNPDFDIEGVNLQFV
jgi:hypothetical protein